MKFIIVNLIIVMSCYNLLAQNSSATVDVMHAGKECPNFKFDEVENFSKKQASIQDFRGKWLVLDFWNEYCSGCIASFPEINETQQKFKDNTKIVSVAYTGSQYMNHVSSYHRIKKLYQRLKNELSLDLTVAYDSVIFKQLDIVGCPQYLIVSPEGKIVYFSPVFNGEILKLLINGYRVPTQENGEMATPYTVEYKTPELPWMTTTRKEYGVSDTSFLYRSYLAKWNPTQPSFIEGGFLANDNKGKMDLLNIGLDQLILFSIFQIRVFPGCVGNSPPGLFYKKVFYKVKDTTRFTSDPLTGRNRYIYSLKVPAENASVDYMSHIMRDDLERYFNLRLTVDSMEMPCLNLVIIDKQLANKIQHGDSVVYKKYKEKMVDNIGLVVLNRPFDKIVLELDRRFKQAEPLINETGIEGGVTMAINCPLWEYDKVVKELAKYGLGIQRGKKMMKILVVSDQ